MHAGLRCQQSCCQDCGRAAALALLCCMAWLSRRAGCRYILSYNSHQMKDIFNVHTLDLAAVAKSFGFSNPPKVGLLLPACDMLVRLRAAASCQLLGQLSCSADWASERHR